MSRGKNMNVSDYAKLEERLTRIRDAARYSNKSFDLAKLIDYRGAYFNNVNAQRVHLTLRQILEDATFTELWRIAQAAQKEMLRYSHAVKEFFVGEADYIEYKLMGYCKPAIGRTLSYEDRMQLIRIQ